MSGGSCGSPGVSVRSNLQDGAMSEDKRNESSEGGAGSNAGANVADDLPAGDLPAIPVWGVWLGFGVWAAWLVFLVVAAFSVHR